MQLSLITPPRWPGKLLRRNSRRYLARHPWLMALSILGVALGVAVVVGIDLANSSARTAFRLSTETVTGRATHAIVPGSGLLQDDTYRQLRTETGFRNAAPVLEGYTRAGAETGPVLQILGIDPLAEEPFRSYTGGPQGNLDLGAFMGPSLTGLISRSTAERLGIQSGDSLPLYREGKTSTIVILDIMDPEPGFSEASLTNMLIVDIATAQSLLNAPGQLSRIDLILNEDGRAAQLEKLERALTSGARIEPASTRSSTLDQMTQAFSLNLTAMSLLAMVVGMFLIYNTMTFSVVQRRSLIGRLRGIGVTAREISGLILAEAAVVGLIGSTIGMVSGIFLGHVLVDLVTRSINDLYFTVRIQELNLSWLGLGKGLLVGMGATVLAAFAPAREATRAMPSTVLRRSEDETRIESRGRLLRGIGFFLALLGALILWTSGSSIALSYVGILFIILAAALWIPSFANIGSRALRPLMGRFFGIVGRMAASGIHHSLSRSAVAIAALTVAVAATSGVGIMVDSFRTTVDTWLRYSLEADIYVSPPGMVFRRNDATIDTQVEQQIRAMDGVAETYSVRTARVQIDGRMTDLVVTEPRNRELEPGRYKKRSSYDHREAMVSRDVIMVSEPYAFRYNTDVGDSLQVMTASGPRTFEVGAIYYDYASDLGVVQMARSRYETHFTDRYVSGLAIYAADGVDIDELIDNLKSATADGQGLLIRSNRSLRQASLDVFDQTFTVTAVLRLLTILVAFIGVLTALMALQLERARELSVLRANGMTPGQVQRMVTTQTGLMGLLSGLLSVPLGLLLAWLLIFVINQRSFGWTLQFDVDLMVLFQAVLLAVIAALLAGWIPGRSMSRMNATEALRFE